MGEADSYHSKFHLYDFPEASPVIICFINSFAAYRNIKRGIIDIVESNIVDSWWSCPFHYYGGQATAVIEGKIGNACHTASYGN